MPQTSHVCSPRYTGRPQRHRGVRVQARVGSRSPALTGQYTVPHDALHHAGIRVAWFLSRLHDGGVALKSHHPGHVRASKDGSGSGPEAAGKERPHPSVRAWHGGCSCLGLCHQLQALLQKLLGFQHGRAWSTLSGGGPRQGHPRRPTELLSILAEDTAAKCCPMDERPTPASNGNWRKGEKTFKESSLPARSCRRRAHTRTHNVLQNC